MESGINIQMGMIKEMIIKGVRKKGKIKNGNKLPISDIFFQN
jgi:hypothetical protein